MALRTGAHLVPVFSFGENDVFDVVKPSEGSWAEGFQLWLKQSFGFTLPLAYGECGLLPKREPIFTVVGTPVECPHVAEPTAEEIAWWHNKYMEALLDLWNEHNNSVAFNRVEGLDIDG